jgi:hypothetical protein
MAVREDKGNDPPPIQRDRAGPLGEKGVLARLVLRLVRGKPKRRRPLKTRLAERQLLFWTIGEAFRLTRQALWLLLFASLVVYSILSLIEGRLPSVESILSLL